MGCSKQGLLRRERFENSRNYFDRSFKNVVGGGGIYFFVPPFFLRVWPIFTFLSGKLKFFQLSRGELSSSSRKKKGQRILTKEKVSFRDANQNIVIKGSISKSALCPVQKPGETELYAFSDTNTRNEVMTNPRTTW